jgi:hypothetical protein
MGIAAGQSYSVTVSGDLRLHGELNIFSGSLNLNANSAALSVGSGIVLSDFPSSSLILGGPLQLSGSFLMGPRATFSASNQTVTLDGINQTLSGALTFYNLTKIVSSADTLTVTRPSVITVSGALTLAGGTSSSQYLALRSSVNSAAWTLRRLGTVSATNLDLRDTNNIGAEITCIDCVDYGNTSGWIFTSSAVSSASSSSATTRGGGRRSITIQSLKDAQSHPFHSRATANSSSAMDISVEERVRAILKRRVTLPKNPIIVERLRTRLMKLYSRYAK